MSAADLTEIVNGISKGNGMLGLITLHEKGHPLISVKIVKGIRMRQAMRLGEFSHTGHEILHSISKLLVTHTSKRIRVVTRSLSRLEVVRTDFGSPRLSLDENSIANNRRDCARRFEAENETRIPHHLAK